MSLAPEQLAQGARRILSDPAFVDAINELDDGYIQEWRTAPSTEEREAAFHKQEALGAVVRQLETLISRAP